VTTWHAVLARDLKAFRIVQRVIKATAQSTRFFKLQVLSVGEGKDQNEAFVEFRVWFKNIEQKGTGKQPEQGSMQTMTERSRFERLGARWMYVEAASLDNTHHSFPEA
jgi:uncharacterized protein YchJ